MKSLLICFAAMLMLIGIPWVFSSIDNAMTDDLSQSFAGVSTGAGIYSANVTLGKDLYNNSVGAVTDVSSNLTGIDTPLAYSYNSVSNILTVSGLDASQSRTLTVEFLIDTETTPAEFLTILVLFRWFYVFSILGLEAGAIYAFYRD